MPHLNQRGVAHILLLLAGLGVVAFLLVSSSAEFKNNLFGRLFPKQFSQAAISGPITPVYVQRIDSGSTSNFTDSTGNVWSADRAFSTGSYGYIGGSSYTGDQVAIANTTDDQLYRNTRYGSSFEYRFTVPNGTYTVTLKLAEIRSASCVTGARVFNVAAEGTVVITNNDTFARVGCATAGDRTFTFTVSDGVLNFNFTTVAGFAAVNGIEVVSQTTGTPAPTPAPTQTPIRIETERMTLISGYRVRSGTFASGGAFINLFETQAATGVATTTFSGSSGTYNVTVRYFDENDGNATLQLSVGGQVVDIWTLSEATSSNAPAASNARVHTVSAPVNLTNGSTVTILGTRNNGDNASVDYIDFTPTPTPTPTPVPVVSKRVFVTSTTYNGNLGGLDGANSLCQTRADAASLGGSWRAWLSIADVAGLQADYRLNHNNGPYQLINGTTIANNWDDLIDGTLMSPINITELNSPVTGAGSLVWTNTNSLGRTNSPSGHCNYWSSTTDTINGTTLFGGTGSSSQSSSSWTFSGSLRCTFQAALYCFEQ